MSATPRRAFGDRAVAVAAVVGIIVLVSGGSALAAVPAVGEIQVVSVDTSGTSGTGFVSNGQISADGRYVVFASTSQDLVTSPAATGGNYDVFRRDLVTGVTELVSYNSTGLAHANAGSGGAVISADGRYVAFDSTASDIDPLDMTSTDDVFIRDMTLGVTTLVSVNAAGTASGNDYSVTPSISADGSIVTFASKATDLVATDANGFEDIFIRNVGSATPTTKLVSVSSAQVQGDAASGYSASPMSSDGRYVTFDSTATNLVPGATLQQVYLRDTLTATTTLVSVNGAGTAPGTGYSSYQAISADGTIIAFSSDAPDIGPGDSNGVQDIFVRDLTTGTTTLVTVSTGAGTAQDSYNTSISPDGKFVGWNSDGTNLVATPVSGNGDVYVRSLVSGTTSLVSVNAAGTAGGSNSSYGITFSSDGKTVAFASSADDLTAADPNGVTDMLAKGLDTTTLATPKPVLAATGSRFSPETAWVGFGLIAAGLALVLTRRRRGSHAA